VELGFRANLLWDLSRPVTPASDDATRATLQAMGIALVDAADVMAI
jgi:nicotinamidase/pyrazinamidase